MLMDPHALRREAKAGALSSLRVLSQAFSTDAEAQEIVTQMIEQIEQFDVKPPRPTVGVLVIGDAVTAAPAAAAAPSFHTLADATSPEGGAPTPELPCMQEQVAGTTKYGE